MASLAGKHIDELSGVHLRPVLVAVVEHCVHLL
jgi:hypothetical protein